MPDQVEYYLVDKKVLPEVFIKVMKEFHREDLPILYNINIGHAFPTGIIPLGLDMQIDFTDKRIIIAE